MQMNEAEAVEGLSETQERLLRAALFVIYEQGIDKATTRRIAERAGVNLQLIQYHFGGKAGLIQAAQDYTRAHFYALIEPAVAASPDLAAAIRAGLEATWRAAHAAPELLMPDLLLQVRRHESRGPGERLPSRAANEHVAGLLSTVAKGRGQRLRVPMSGLITLLMSSAAGLLLEYRISGDEAAVGEGFALLAQLLESLVEAG